MRTYLARHLVRNMSTHTKYPISPVAATFPESRARRGDLVRFPGVTADTTEAVRRLLTENDRRFHIYEKVSCESHTAHIVRETGI